MMMRLVLGVSVLFVVVLKSSIAIGECVDTLDMVRANMSSSSVARFPAVFLFHGGGPLPLLNDPAHRELVASWHAILDDVLRVTQRPPKAIVVVSAHYSTRRGQTGLGGAAKPKMRYDYGGFPEESYRLQYPAPGAPALAAEIASKVQALLGRADAAVVEPDLPFDHGVFVPLMKLFPEATIPVVPMSVMAGDHAGEHMAVGRALSALRDAPHDVLVIGSGSSMHHFQHLFHGPDGAGTAFNDAVTAVLCDASISPEKRLATLEGILSFPGAGEAHPKGQAEHLMPLLTIVGSADGGPAKEVSNLAFMHGNIRQYVFP